MAGDALARVLRALDDAGCKRRNGPGGHCCPAHPDKNPSLSVNNGNGMVVLKCHAGAACTVEEIVAALGLRMADLRDSDQCQAPSSELERDWTLDDYHDEHGNVQYQKVRKPGKVIRFRRPGRIPGTWEWGVGKDTQRVLFRLPDVLAAVREGRTVYVAEGEPDCKRLISRGYTATCNDNGASTSGHAARWLPSYTHTLIGAHVVVIADNDPPGFAHARYIARELTGKAASVRLVRGAVNEPKADFSDHDDAGLGVDDLIPLRDGDEPPTLEVGVPAKMQYKSGDNGGRTARTLRLTKASEITMRRIKWLWDARIVLGGLTLLAGREGIGKSCVAVDICTQVTRGALPGEMQGKPRNVIYVNSEDARDYTIVPRLVAAGADLDRVIFLDAVTGDDEYESNIVLPLDTELLAETVAKHDAAMVVLDAATSVIDSRLDGDKDRQIRQALEAIARKVGERTGSAVLGIVHFSKRDSADTGKLILGSIAWSQVARSTLAVAQDSDTGQLVLTASKANLAPGDTPSLAARIVSVDVSTPEGTTNVGRVEWLGETDEDARDLLDPDAVAGRSERDEALGWLRDFLGAGRVKSLDAKRAATAAGISERTLQRARTQLKVMITAEGFPRTSYWALPARQRSGATARGATGVASGASRTCSVGTIGSTTTDLGKQGGTTDGTTVGTTGGVGEGGTKGPHAGTSVVPMPSDRGITGVPGSYASCASGASEHARARASSLPDADDWPTIPSADDLGDDDTPRLVCSCCGQPAYRLQLGACTQCLWRTVPLEGDGSVEYSAGTDTEEQP